MTVPPHLPAPTFGVHEPVARYGLTIGSVVDVMGQWTPVCTHRTCWRRLMPRDTRHGAKAALRNHWAAAHQRKAAA